MIVVGFGWPETGDEAVRGKSRKKKKKVSLKRGFHDPETFISDFRFQ
jgi:hypothetical protein